eukprot:8120-Pyramimonas_sp.AAC.1
MPNLLNPSEKVDPDDCPHPLHARWDSENQHGTFGKCMTCGDRVWHQPFSEEEKLLRAQRRHESER